MLSGLRVNPRPTRRRAPRPPRANRLRPLPSLCFNLRILRGTFSGPLTEAQKHELTGPHHSLCARLPRRTSWKGLPGARRQLGGCRGRRGSVGCTLLPCPQAQDKSQALPPRPVPLRNTTIQTRLDPPHRQFVNKLTLISLVALKPKPSSLKSTISKPSTEAPFSEAHFIRSGK